MKVHRLKRCFIFEKVSSQKVLKDRVLQLDYEVFEVWNSLFFPRDLERADNRKGTS